MRSNRWCHFHWSIWSTPYKANHIRFLQLLAIKHALVKYRELRKKCQHISLKSDNTTGIAYVNNMRGIVSNSCNHSAREIWETCIASRVWLTAVYVPGKENITADFMSTLQNENTEWRLSPAIFHKVLRVLYCKPDINFFASCLSYQIPNYVSWHSNNNAIAIHAFSMSQSFPPFSVIGAAVAKIVQQHCSGISSLVSHDGTITSKLPCVTTTKHLDFIMEQISATPIIPKNETVGHSVIRQAFQNTSISPEIANVITDPWRTKTKNRYESAFRRMVIYVTSRNSDSYIADVNTVLAFLHGVYLNKCFIVVYVLLVVRYPVLSQLKGS